MFVSLDDGKSWQPLRLNLPAVPITDIRARKDGLVVATQGRAFWILDDVFVVRQAGDDLEKNSLTVFKAPVTVQGRSSGSGGAAAAAAMASATASRPTPKAEGGAAAAAIAAAAAMAEVTPEWPGLGAARERCGQL